MAAAACLTLWPGCEPSGERGKTAITFWTISLRPTFSAYMTERIAAFESMRPGVRVDWVDVPFEAIERKLLAAAAAGRAPDVVNLSDMMFARFAAAGAFADLGGDDLDLSVYHPGALAVGQIGPAQLAVPWYLTTQSVIVNEALLERGGLSVETLGRTWPDLIEQARAFHERSGAYLFTQPLGTDSQLPMMLLADGLVPLRLDEHGEIRADASRAEVRAFLAAWVSLYRDGALPREAATRGFEHLIDVYQNERVAMVNTGANFLARVRDVSRSVYDQTRVLPPVVGRLGAAHIAVMPVCVSAQTDAMAEAVAWAGFITSAESQGAFCRLAPIVPSTRASLADPFFTGPTDDERAAGLELLGTARGVVTEALVSGAAFTPPLEAWPDMRRVFNERIKGVLLGGSDLGETLAAIDAEWNTILDAMNARRRAAGIAPAGAEVLRGVAGASGAAP